MCKLFLTIVSLVSVMSFSGISANSDFVNWAEKVATSTTKKKGSARKKAVSSVVVDNTCSNCFITARVKQPSTQCSTDGLISLSLAESCPEFSSAIFYLTHFETTISSTDGCFKCLPGGTYCARAVLLDANNACICTTDSLSITLTPNDPTCCILAICPENPTICPGNCVDLTVVSPTAVFCNTKFDYVWKFSDSSEACETLVGSGPVVTACRPGTYTVFAHNHSEDCEAPSCCSSASVTVTEGTLPCFCISGNTTTCTNGTINLSVVPCSTDENLSAVWTGNFPGSPFSGLNLSITPQASGTVTVVVTDANTGCSDSACIEFTVNPPPTIEISPVCVCLGSQLVLTFTVTVNDSCTQGGTVIITGPNCFFTEVPLNGGGIFNVPVATFATDCNMGCYSVTAIDCNGCFASTQAFVGVLQSESCCTPPPAKIK